MPPRPRDSGPTVLHPHEELEERLEYGKLDSGILRVMSRLWGLLMYRERHLAVPMHPTILVTEVIETRSLWLTPTIYSSR